MSRSTPGSDNLDEIHELNRLFLEFLKARACAGGDCWGLGRRIVGLLAGAPSARLDVMAAFPRALFRLRLDRIDLLRVLDPAADAGERSRHALQLTILHSAWNMSRRSEYSARLFLGLNETHIRKLRTTPLSELLPMSASSDLMSCGFLEAPWLWKELLTETRPESRRQLLLIGLQPQVHGGGDTLLKQGEQASA
jgi:hypothetical protein